ncbi:MAG: nitrous oxide reductase family maturation protein NosD [Promethearchaeota archaeon]
MKSTLNPKLIILLVLGIFFVVSPLFIYNPINKNREYNTSSNYIDQFVHKNLKISAVSGPIYIDDINPSFNWSVAKEAGICTGSGTYSDPYIIEDLVINVGGRTSGIIIENSNVYFRIENCTLYNSGDYSNQGIRLLNVTNAQLIENNCSNGFYEGIYLLNSYNNSILGNIANNNRNGIYGSFCDYNNISGNTVNNNIYFGLILGACDNNTISGNIANNNLDGIILGECNNNSLSRNTANDNLGGRSISLSHSNNNIISGNIANNSFVGIHLSSSNNNTISGNITNDNQYGLFLANSNNNTITGNILLGNDYCITDEYGGANNNIKNNDCGRENGLISGYNLFFLFGIFSFIAILISRKLKQS